LFESSLFGIRAVLINFEGVKYGILKNTAET